MTDELARHNKERWEALAQSNVEWSRPSLNLDANGARQMVDVHDMMGDVQGKQVLCLGGGGGQQSVAFGLLGAKVTVLDISETQLERDRQALAHYDFEARLEQGDMRHLSRFADDSFDLVWNASSINFVPDTTPIFDEVKRVLRRGGLYHLSWGNPFSPLIEEASWTGEGYLLKRPYADSEKILDDPYWEIHDADGTVRRVIGPREFNHTLSTVINGLIGRSFTLLGIWEEILGDPDAEPGTWEHLKSVAPHDLTLWAAYTG